MKEQSNELTVPKSVTADLSQIGSWSVDRKDVLSLVMQEKEEALFKAKKAFEDEHPEIVSAINSVQSNYKKQVYESMMKSPAVSDFMAVNAYANVLLSRDKIDSYLKDTVLPNHPTITKGLTSIVDTYSSIAPNAQITHSIRIDGFYSRYRSGKSRSKYKAEEYKIVVPSGNYKQRGQDNTIIATLPTSVKALLCINIKDSRIPTEEGVGDCLSDFCIPVIFLLTEQEKKEMKEIVEAGVCNVWILTLYYLQLLNSISSLPSIERAMRNRMTRKILSSSLEGKEILQFAKDAAAGIAEVPSLPDLTSGITKKEKKSSKRK